MIRLCLGDVPLLDHPFQHIPLPLFGLIHMLERRIAVGGFRETGKHCHFSEIELLHVLGKIGFGGKLDPVRTGPQVNLVKIDIKDFVLGELLFHPCCQNCFLELAGELLFRSQQHRLGNLLGDGGGPLLFAEMNNVLEHRPDNPQVIKPLVLVEIRVLCGDKSLNQAARNLVDFNDGPALQVELADKSAVITKNL